ncbi:Cytochrome P450 [Mycena venus]|uniref:Cytochrome P450 n=1 Tax=Mycena venus TaxID=2733690 RepID=A0A8H6WYM7_9AGAR|nr:Cytochrome P450 [Mycena venus]
MTRALTTFLSLFESFHSSGSVVACAAPFLITLVLVLFRPSLTRTKLPPGPMAFPFVGNLLSLPTTQKAQGLRDMEQSKSYGDITYFHGLGQSLVILNNRHAMSELFIRRSDITGGRPTLTMCGELVGYNKAIVLKQPGKEFREMRKELGAAVGKGSALSRNKLLRHQELGRYLSNLLETPSLLFEHNRWLIGTYTLSIAYGYRPTKFNDTFIIAAERALAEFVDLIQPGTWIVDLFPFLKHVVLRLPFTRYKETISRYQESQKALSITPFRMVKSQLARGTAPESVCATLINKFPTRSTTEEDEAYLAWIAGNIYAGGSDTTVSSLCSFYLAMCLSPTAKKKAQAEIDAFTERMDRFPNANEKDRCPYICALISELYRWAIVAPLGIPHMFTEDVEYNGYLIPRNTTILVNAWAISQDPEIYPEPDQFRPERFLGNKQQLDPREYAFGGGRRLCPGIDLADTMMFLALSGILAVFEICPLPSCPLSYAFRDAFSRHPLPFECSITVRSSRAQDWINVALAE